MQTIASAFVKAKRAFGPALKDKTNPAFRSKYADLGACIDSVEDALLSNGIAFIQETSEDATGVTVETVFLHESGETLRCGKLHVPASKQDPQGYGSALTYARRYSLMAACGIAPEDDDGNAAVTATKAMTKRAPPKTGVKADVLSQHPPLSKDETDYLDELADEILQDVANKVPMEDVYQKLEETNLELAQKVYLSALLPATVMRQIREVAEAKHRVPS
jgi:hypothetical protein